MCVSTHLLQNDLPWVEPLEVDEGEDEVDDGEGDEDDGQLPPQPGQQVEGLVLLGESPNVVAESQMFLGHFCSWRQHHEFGFKIESHLLRRWGRA